MERLKASAKQLGLPLSQQQLNAFQLFHEDLVEWNEQFNLTAITEYEQVQIRHFADSLSCLVAIRQAGRLLEGRALRCIDVGSGAGFPGIPIKIYCPQMNMVLLEATGKKVDFMAHVIAHLGLKEIQAVKGRAEELAKEPLHREQYDLVLARAVAELPVLAEYTLPFCRLGGTVIAQKGVRAQEEAHSAEYAVSMLGGQVRRVIPIELLGLAETRNLVVIEKTARTPEKYPRRPGMPAKRPLAPP
ncbi:MAG TPA: 16S rRNA (guanine(527)-N(7))-methyltransferase RsmG [Anaerolineae bacterium]|nr:16S rRNA (guanine(527)-N(7))-methyltransferase RsmG [Anaerolineae bacterium]